MLGFSPLASAPLGDDGVAADIIYIINGVGVTTGQPVVGSSSLAQDQDLSLVAIVTGSLLQSVLQVLLKIKT